MAKAFRFKLRRDSAYDWETQNPVLADGEPGYERDTGRLKIGDGVTPWVNLEHLMTRSETTALIHDVLNQRLNG